MSFLVSNGIPKNLGIGSDASVAAVFVETDLSKIYLLEFEQCYEENSSLKFLSDHIKALHVNPIFKCDQRDYDSQMKETYNTTRQFFNLRPNGIPSTPLPSTLKHF